MAKQQPNQLDLIKALLDNAYIDTSNVLIEREVTANGTPFEMKRQIVTHHGIDFLLFRFDPNKVKLFPYFHEKSGLKKICDYIIFAEEGVHLYILLIELKLGTETATKQLIASEVFAKFIIDSARRVDIDLTKNIKTIKMLMIKFEKILIHKILFLRRFF